MFITKLAHICVTLVKEQVETHRKLYIGCFVVLIPDEAIFLNQ